MTEQDMGRRRGVAVYEATTPADRTGLVPLRVSQASREELDLLVGRVDRLGMVVGFAAQYAEMRRCGY